MSLRKVIIILVLAFITASLAQSAIAEEGTEFSTSISMKDNLLKNIGKRVSVRISSGDPIEGTILKVGEQNVHLSKLSGKDFYDAIVRIDKIEAVIFKAR